MIRYTERLTIVPVSLEDFSYYTKHYKANNLLLNHLNDLKSDSSLFGWGPWFVIRNKDQKVIGDIGFKGVPDLNGYVEIGYGFILEARGQGYATESVKNLVDWAFTKEAVKYIKAKCLKDNLASIRVLEKLQMTRVKEENNLIHWELDKEIMR